MSEENHRIWGAGVGSSSEIIYVHPEVNYLYLKCRQCYNALWITVHLTVPLKNQSNTQTEQKLPWENIIAKQWTTVSTHNADTKGLVSLCLHEYQHTIEQE